MKLLSWMRSVRSARSAVGRHVRTRLRARTVDSPHRLSRTGLPPKPYDGTDATVSGLPNGDDTEEE
ncbi:hypothetical protein C474_03225 [Halogeometricum pallidum JCM 14848]|uniref:Uncharacterized protein n=1 Tax=Halogeometricum pallidum JCM 14848 TaxID=1227487 RepID=M0DGL2_HALPD|nr:hypothetical protein [Halogeometricum pallidum]ELZ33938.1 hypothetical protein C474_03225 [Halogeometricum pallidum JCM 14848]